MATAPPKPYQNPFRAIGGMTVAGGANTGVMGALQHPDEFNRSSFLADKMRASGGSPAMTLPALNPFATVGGIQSSMGHGGYGGGYGQPRIHGYSGGGIPTNLFSQLTGRAPTASDVEMANGGGLSPQFNQMGSLNQFDAMQRSPSQWQMLQIMAGAPTTTASPSMARTPLQDITADNIPPNTMMAADGGDVPAGNPVIVGERGPEMIVPQHNVSVIPHEYLPVLHLLNGQMEQYLKRHLR